MNRWYSSKFIEEVVILENMLLIYGRIYILDETIGTKRRLLLGIDLYTVLEI